MKNELMAVFTVLAVITFAATALATHGNGRHFGDIYLNGNTVQTFGVNANLPHGGTDPLYMVINGVSGQLGVAGLGPGEQGYSGGDWAVYEVTFNTGVTPYLLTSDEAVLEAENTEDVTVTRVMANDFRCPIIP